MWSRGHEVLEQLIETHEKLMPEVIIYAIENHFLHVLKKVVLPRLILHYGII